MSDQLEIKSGTAESVALDLALKIAHSEKLVGDSDTFRKKLLDLYAECLTATTDCRTISE